MEAYDDQATSIGTSTLGTQGLQIQHLHQAHPNPYDMVAILKIIPKHGQALKTFTEACHSGCSDMWLLHAYLHNFCLTQVWWQENTAPMATLSCTRQIPPRGAQKSTVQQFHAVSRRQPRHRDATIKPVRRFHHGITHYSLSGRAERLHITFRCLRSLINRTQVSTSLCVLRGLHHCAACWL